MKSENHEKVKIHNFALIQLQICVQEYFFDWLTYKRFSEVYKPDIRDFYSEGEIWKPWKSQNPQFCSDSAQILCAGIVLWLINI